MFQSKTLSGSLNKTNIKLLFVILILLSAGLLRFSLLFTTHQYPSGDEALAGMMAKQLSEGGKIFIKTYGVAYAGGGYIEVYLIALTFKIFGVSNISLKLPIVLVSLTSLLLVILLGFKVFGNIGGIIWGIIYGFCPIFMEWNLIVKSGYIELLVFIPFLILFFMKIYEKNKFKDIVFLGIISAIAFWNHPIILSLLIAFCLFFFLNFDKGFFKAIIYILISILPRIIIELCRDTSVLLQTHITSMDFENFFSKISRVFYFDLPAFFTSENVDKFIESIPITAYFWYAIVILAIISVIIR